MSPEERPVNLHINLAAPRARLQGTLQRTTDLVSFGLTVAENAAPTDPAAGPDTLRMPGVAMQFVAAQDRAMNPAQAKDEFVLWALQCGFRDIVEGLHDFLEEVRVVCSALSLGPRFQVSPGWHPPFTRDSPEGVTFHWKAFDQKLQRLQDDYQVRLSPELHTAALAINKARNCLAHRRGVVGSADLNVPEGLRIHWRSMAFIVKDDASGAEQPLVLNQVIEGASTVVLRVVAAERLFQRGERISLTPVEFTDLCLTLMAVAEELGSAVVQYGRSKGFPIDQGTGQAPPVGPTKED